MPNSMYLKQLIDKNVGPLTDIHIDFPFYDNGDPKPVVLVGENGTGKSTLLSNIVDAFFEMAEKAYTNATHPIYRNGHQYFKAITPHEIHTGASSLYSFISFMAENNPSYVFKSGNISVDEFKKQIGNQTINVSWKENENKKMVTASKDIISKLWSNNIVCYFGPDRYEKPVWMGDKYYQTEDYLHLTVNNDWDGELKNQIMVRDVLSSNLQWLLDVIADSRADIEGSPTAMKLGNTTSADMLFILKQARNNLEKILSKIIGEDVFFQLNYRNSGGSRFRIVKKSDNSVICPTLDSLSTGQLALFNLFATIIRYADNNNINQSIHLDNITGIVVIDEIELHLHSKLQKEFLPELLKLFPKIQFVISSHAPLFLLGMKDTFGEDGFAVYEMPTASRISTEAFAEFQKAYDYLKETETYQCAVKNAIDAVRPNGKAIIITEGSTDWKHLKAAYEHLQSGGMHGDLFDGIDFEFLEYEPADSSETADIKLNMGNTVLSQLCDSMSKIPQPVKYIFIADRDDEKTNKKMSVSEEPFKKWGNNVYSFILPIPPHRIATPAISIEHYYTDDEIKTEWREPETGTAYRLFMGNEFDERGIANHIDRYCEKRNKCGRSSIAIIEGSSGEKVTSISDNNGMNYALPKSKFAKMILEKQAPFDNFNFESFIPVFEIIRDIVNDQEGAHA